jgi:hypothetical protein
LFNSKPCVCATCQCRSTTSQSSFSSEFSFHRLISTSFLSFHSKPFLYAYASHQHHFHHSIRNPLFFMQVVVVTFIIQLKTFLHLNHFCCSTLDFLYLCVIAFVIQFQTFSLCASWLCYSVANLFFLSIGYFHCNSKPLSLCVGHLHYLISNLFFSNHAHCVVLNLLFHQVVVQFKTFSFSLYVQATFIV